jgi:hypothetical protein
VGDTYESRWGRRYGTRGRRGDLMRGAAALRLGGSRDFDHLETDEEQAGRLGHVGRDADRLVSCWASMKTKRRGSRLAPGGTWAECIWAHS